ncbi:MAG TPA: hypothetical protein VGB26_01875, partial [Nitrospiria bacterium]
DRSDRYSQNLTRTAANKGQISDEERVRGFHRGQETNQISTHRPDICKQSVPCLPQLKNILAKRDGSIYVLGILYSFPNGDN